MRFAFAALTGVVLAVLAAVGVVQLVNTAQGEPVGRPLYNYGSR